MLLHKFTRSHSTIMEVKGLQKSFQFGAKITVKMSDISLPRHPRLGKCKVKNDSERSLVGARSSRVL